MPQSQAPPSATEIAQPLDLSDEARALLRKDLPPERYLKALAEHARYADAFKFLAGWLPKRAAVWWGCLCLWSAARPEPPGPVAAALQAALHWVQQPTEENRRAAGAMGDAAGTGTPAGAVAMAAFWSGGSMSAPDLPEVAPPPTLTAATVAAAVWLAAQQPPAKTAERCRQFLQWGLDTANGKNLWQK